MNFISKQELKMQITHVERIILINQYKILSQLDVSDKVTYENYLEILSQGYENKYEFIMEQLSEFTLSREDCDFVDEIFGLYRMIENFKNSNPDHNLSMDKYYFSIFRGFDGNNECKLYSYAKFVVEKLGLWEEQNKFTQFNDKMNSRSQMANHYSTLINNWKKYEKKQDLTEDEIVDLVSISR